MHKLTLYSKDLKKSSQVNLPENLSADVNVNLLATAKHVYNDRRHKGSAYAKTRAEVDITKKKIYKQKGTGGARHGSRRAPIFVGGGVAHGPKGVKRVLELPSKVRKIALRSALAHKASEGKLFAVEGLGQITKTRDFATIVKEIANSVTVLLVVPSGNKDNVRAGRNLAKANVVSLDTLNVYEVLSHSVVILDASLVENKTPKTKSNTKPKTKTK